MPLDVVNAGQSSLMPVGGPPPQSGPGQVSLNVLVDMIVQRTYHELAILAELLPRKTDMERKIEIFNFASRTRMLFIRLLALVRWASSASKVDKCNSIMMFLDKQSNIFLETADMLHKTAHETLVRATLPNFHLPAAAEILTTGDYSRLPRCIKERIIKETALTPVEKRNTMLRLNQVIEHRIVNSKIPLQMRNLSVADGTVTFTVQHEFSARLTLMGDAATQPWTLLGIEMLVEDKETGQGKSLMHSMHVHWVQGLIQTRLVDNSDPLHEVYNMLHTLAQLLQLEVLSSQTRRLANDRLGDYTRIEEYILGKALTISYWRELSNKDPAQEIGFRLSIQVDPHDPARPLLVVHTPSLTPKEAQMADRSIRTEHLSIESLLVHTIYVRTRSRLTELRTEVQRRLGLGDVEATLHGSPAVLSIPILQPCLRSEQLLVAVDTHTGIFLAHVPQYPTNPYSPQIQTCLNGDRGQLEVLVSELRYWITARRIEKTLQQLPASPFEQLPLVYNLNTHPLSKLGRHKMFVRLHRQPAAILVVEFAEKKGRECEIQYNYYYLLTRSCSIEDDPKDETVVSEIPRVYMKALGMIEFDPFLVTHGTTTKVDVQELSEKIIGKRKPGGKVEAPIKRTKFPAYFISDLAHVVSFSDERIPFASMEAELTKQGVYHSGTAVEANAIGLSICVLRFPPVPNLNPEAMSSFCHQMLSSSLRLSRRSGSSWVMEWVMSGAKVGRVAPARAPLYSHYELQPDSAKTVAAIIGELHSMVHLHSLVTTLHRYMQSEALSLGNTVSIKSYNYRSLVLEYGPSGTHTVNVSWNNTTNKFALIFGGTGEAAGMCPHSLMKSQLELHLNRHRNLALLAKILHETVGPVRSLCRLPITPHKGITMQRNAPLVQTFSILPQSPTHVKIIFYSIYCVDIHIRGEGIVSIRDGSFSMFDQRKPMEELIAIPGFKAFLSKYVDESAFARRASQTEDDNPPSPVMEDQKMDEGLKFPNPIPSPSNPIPSPSSTFLQSPPSLPGASPNPFPAPSPVNPISSVGSPFTSSASPLGAGSPHPRPSPRHPGSSPHPHLSSHPTQTRILPQRLWAASIPTPLTHKAFDEICKPSSLAVVPGLTSPAVVSPLHRFLGCVFMRRQLQHIIKTEEHLTDLTNKNNEPSIIAFKVESLQCKVHINPQNSFQSLHLKLCPDDPSQWQPDQLATIERFFDTKVVAPPYRPNTINGFCRLLNCPADTLKNIVHLMKYEVQPELVVQNKLKWAVSLCLTIPPVAPNVFPVGQPGVHGNKEKILMFMHLTRVNMNLLPRQEPFSVVVPVVYNITQNQTSLASLQKELNNSALHTVQQHLTRFARNNPQVPGRCSILPAIHDLLANLQLPNEGFPGGPGGPYPGGGFPGGPGPGPSSIM